MTAPVTLLSDIAPEFDDLDSELISRTIARAAAQINAETWGSLYVDGCNALAAHFLTMRDRGLKGQTGGGMLTSESSNGVSFGYDSPADPDRELKTSRHGLEYLRLRKKLALTPVVDT